MVRLEALVRSKTGARDFTDRTRSTATKEWYDINRESPPTPGHTAPQLPPPPFSFLNGRC
jgi:hypothetical protein